MEILIVIYLYIAQKWLCKLKYEYKDIYKYILIDKHGQLNIIKDYKIFLNTIEELKLYIVKFDKNNAIKPKIYYLNYIIKSNH